MIISDLNHLEVVEAANIIGGSYGYVEYDRFDNEIESEVRLKGNAAESFANAAAFGKNTFSKTVNDTLAVAGVKSLSSGASVSAASK